MLKNVTKFPLSVPCVGDLITRTYFNVATEAPNRQLLSWRDRIGSTLDVLPTREQIENPFQAWANRYTVGEISYADTYSDSVRVERSLSKISTSRAFNYFLFTVCTEGNSHTIEGKYSKQISSIQTKVLVLDMDQPIRAYAHRHRLSAFFVPRSAVESILPNADSLHGRTIDGSSPAARLLIHHTAILNDEISTMSNAQADRALRTTIQLLVTAFGKQARLSGNARAAARSAMFDLARSYIRKNLDDHTLSAETLLRILQLPRDTLYRMFEHEGGINAFICNCRLKMVADDMINFPHLAVKDIAYGAGFNSASAFSRTFKRVYGITPQDFRQSLSNT